VLVLPGSCNQEDGAHDSIQRCTPKSSDAASWMTTPPARSALQRCADSAKRGPDPSYIQMNFMQQQLIDLKARNTVRRGIMWRHPWDRQHSSEEDDMVRRILVGGSLVAVALTLVAPGVSGAATHARIRPHQFFAGSVNGSLGQPTPATIRVVCPGPSIGMTGHPVSGQTVEVGRSLPAVQNSGYTGNSATSISAFFGAPPPSVGGIGQVSFSRYGVPKPIPTTLSVPCSGSGVVIFVPFPESPPTSRSASVPVRFVNIAVTPVA
jgi:hypothetical protein